MPVTQSAKKAHRQSLTKRSRNRHFTALYREVLKKYEKALAGKIDDAAAILHEVYSAIDTLVKKNVLHKNNGARKKSQAAKLLARSGVASTSAPVAKKAAPAKKAAAPKVKAETAETPAKKPAAKKAPAAKKEAKPASPKKAK